MQMRSGVDVTAPVQTAHDRFKSRSRLRFWVGLSAAGLIHLLVLLGWPEMRAGSGSAQIEHQEMQAIRLVPLVNLQTPAVVRPPPPERVALRERARPARPAPAAAARTTIPTRPPPLELALNDEVTRLAEDAQRRARTAPRVAVPPLPTPAPAAPEPGLNRFRHVTALMQKPELTNRTQVRRALLREYPRALQVRGVEGSVIVWVWIDEKGKVEKYEIRGSSGHLALDEAAERVIPVMKFRPAKERGKAVPVVATLPIKFEVE